MILSQRFKHWKINNDQANFPSWHSAVGCITTDTSNPIDDVVVVVTAEDSASRIDIRSVSRIGRGDRGVNAARIREFIKTFER